jgi:uncharacterized protein
LSLSERLRGIVKPAAANLYGTPRDPHPSTSLRMPRASGEEQRFVPRDDDAVAETLGGIWQERSGHRYLVVDRKYGPGYRHGRVTIADVMPGTDDAWPRLGLLARAPLAGRLLFFDLETTGLAGGAGTYAFLIGCGWFDGPAFRTRQLFLSAFDAEAAMLAGLASLARDAGALVTYNGKSFDLPLIENRFVIHRMPIALSDLPHIDLVHPARRFWRDSPVRDGRSERGDAEASGDSSCRLTSLERTQCGFEREGDVPGFEIPSRYFAYVRSGNARPLAAVLEHNRLDLISLAMLTARTAQMLEEGPAAARSAREALGLGRIYEQGSLIGDAWTSYALAAGISESTDTGRGFQADPTTRAEALRAYALLGRRQRKYEDAAEGWRRLLQLPDCPATLAREASEALAVHHEHRLRDAATARQFASQALLFPSTNARLQAARYRLARLDRKLSTPPALPTSLLSLAAQQQ